MTAIRGRFAPSPTGPLHFGSLVTALASFLDIRQQEGTWLVRIEDPDPLREAPEASTRILRSLEAHGLCWDEPVRYQSGRLDTYHATIEQLISNRQAYYCACSRKELQACGGHHPAHCREHRHRPAREAAVRFALTDEQWQWQDLILGVQTGRVRQELDDPVILRKEGFVAYQLAVVVDDLDQQITRIIRGSDLIANTLPQKQIGRALGGYLPQWGHVPVLVNRQGQKLSKQNHAPAIDDSCPGENLWRALTALGQHPPPELCGAPPATLLHWGKLHWDRAAVARPRLTPHPGP